MGTRHLPKPWPWLRWPRSAAHSRQQRHESCEILASWRHVSLPLLLVVVLRALLMQLLSLLLWLLLLLLLLLSLWLVLMLVLMMVLVVLVRELLLKPSREGRTRSTSRPLHLKWGLHLLRSGLGMLEGGAIGVAGGGTVAALHPASIVNNKNVRMKQQTIYSSSVIGA